MALVAVLLAFALFARFVLRPWISHCLGGADIPNPPVPMAFALIVAAGLPAGLIALTAGSAVVGLVVFLTLLSAYSTVLAFGGFRPPR